MVGSLTDRKMTGIEYVLSEVLEPNLFVIRKQKRDGPDKTTPMLMYYILDGSIYQSPQLCNIFAARVVSPCYPFFSFRCPSFIVFFLLSGHCKHSFNFWIQLRTSLLFGQLRGRAGLFITYQRLFQPQPQILKRLVTVLHSIPLFLFPTLITRSRATCFPHDLLLDIRFYMKLRTYLLYFGEHSCRGQKTSLMFKLNHTLLHVLTFNSGSHLYLWLLRLLLTLLLPLIFSSYLI